MQIARVIGNVVSTSKSEKLDGLEAFDRQASIDLDTFQERARPSSASTPSARARGLSWLSAVRPPGRPR